MQVFRIDKTHHEAAQLLAEGDLTDIEIAQRVGIGRSTLYVWKERPEFAALVAENLERVREEVWRMGGVVRERRLALQNRRWRRLERIMEERAARPEMADIPGGTTGLLTRTITTVSRGDRTETIVSEDVDVGLLKMMMDHEKLMAQETGQWTERREVTGANGGPIQTSVKVIEKADIGLTQWQQRAQRRLEMSLEDMESTPEMENGNGSPHGTQ